MKPKAELSMSIAQMNMAKTRYKIELTMYIKNISAQLLSQINFFFD
jgi:hypothetical protein